jgi:hypothetical protein
MKLRQLQRIRTDRGGASANTDIRDLKKRIPFKKYESVK